MKLPQVCPFVIDLSTQAEAQNLANLRKRPVGIILRTNGDAHDEEVIPDSSQHYHYIIYPEGAKPPVVHISVERCGTGSHVTYHAIILRTDGFRIDLGGWRVRNTAILQAAAFAKLENYTGPIKAED